MKRILCMILVVLLCVVPLVGCAAKMPGYLICVRISGSSDIGPDYSVPNEAHNFPVVKYVWQRVEYDGEEQFAFRVTGIEEGFVQIRTNTGFWIETTERESRVFAISMEEPATLTTPWVDSLYFFEFSLIAVEETE